MKIIEISNVEYQIIKYIYDNYNTPIIGEKMLIPIDKFIIKSNNKYYLSNNNAKMNNILINKLNKYYENIIDNVSNEELENIKNFIFKIYEVNDIVINIPKQIIIEHEE